ncbi:hypothetical protein PSENEW3_00003079 [Picochlorum sp. SENEW3]|nr:hypothetical protein PSENEW3_00003079 [Picochlorum sp. SENEW3]
MPLRAASLPVLAMVRSFGKEREKESKKNRKALYAISPLPLHIDNSNMSMNRCELDRTSRDKVFVTELLIRAVRLHLVVDVARSAAVETMKAEMYGSRKCRSDPNYDSILKCLAGQSEQFWVLEPCVGHVKASSFVNSNSQSKQTVGNIMVLFYANPKIW